jgi:small GTP-binding protein
MKITVVGAVNHGKTSLIESLLDKTLLKSKLELKDFRTRDLQIEDFKIGDTCHYLLDCPGHSAYLNNSILPIRYSDIIFFVFSSVQSILLDKTLALLKYCKFTRKKMVIVITKVDLCTLEELKKRIVKIKEVLKIAEITDYKAILFSTKKPIFKEKLFELITNLSTFEQSSNNYPLILRSFNKNQPGSLISNYSPGIIGYLEGGLKVEENSTYYLQNERGSYPFKVLELKNPGGKGFITCKTDLAGCFCAYNKLKGSIIAKSPIEKNIEVELIFEFTSSTIEKNFESNSYLVNGFSTYQVSLKKIGKSYFTKIPILSDNLFILLQKKEDLWDIIAFGEVKKR